MMMEPFPLSNMCLPTSRVKAKTAFKLTLIIFAKSASDTSTAGRFMLMPALLTRMSILPYFAVISATKLSVLDNSETSFTA